MGSIGYVDAGVGRKSGYCIVYMFKPPGCSNSAVDGEARKGAGFALLLL
jgi:hypothetical protein